MLSEFGYRVKLMAPQFVKPYVKTNKNDMADAESICEEVRRPSMRFLPLKSIEQQAILSVNRARQAPEFGISEWGNCYWGTSEQNAVITHISD